jgi:hypothetical protein
MINSYLILRVQRQVYLLVSYNRFGLERSLKLRCPLRKNSRWHHRRKEEDGAKLVGIASREMLPRFPLEVERRYMYTVTDLALNRVKVMTLT